MKRNLLILAPVLAIFILFNSKAQAQTVTGNVPVNIVLANSFSIVLGPTPAVTFNYSTPADYSATKTVTKAAHFTTFSTAKYTVAVAATGPFTGPTTPATPALGIVQISVNPLTLGAGGTTSAPFLTATNQTLITNANAALATIYTIDYAISAANAASLIGQTTGTYTTNVIYTMTQP